MEKVEYKGTPAVSADPNPNHVPSDAASDEFQEGVQRVRAITTSWSKTTLWVMFVLLYLVSFVDAVLVSVQSSLNPYVTSSFERHGLLTSVSIVSTILSGCSRLTLSKIVDIWGRVAGFLFMLLIVVVGMVMKATCQNIETYFAAHTFYWVGHVGMLYVIDVMVSDMTTLKNRMIMIGINGTPTIASTFAGPRIADLFYHNLNFRWAFGAFGIIIAGVSLPVAVIMLLMERKAAKTGALKIKSGRAWYQSVKHYTLELDIMGIILITAAFALILLPFSISPYAPNGWASGYIIAMEVLGIALLPAFYLWERFVAPVQFLPWKYLKERTIIGSCLLYAVMFVSTFCWNSYFSSYLQVVHRLSITTANYVLNSYSLTSAFISPFVGMATGRFKWAAYVGVPLMLLGTALLIPFRQPSTHVGLLTMTQVLVGLGAAFFTVCGQLAVMAPISHQEIAVVNAIWGLFGSVGAAIGLAVAGAIWNNILPEQLNQRLPEESKNLTSTIFGDIVTQMSYPDGSPERDAIVGAYGDVQRKLAIAGASFMPLILASIVIWKNINVKKLEDEKGNQTKGNVW
ncbi:hypothetical protein DL770_000496 [Monosporascus sp. CRB-9-2]|nr:hypothetical protein DL770_000496 [Monosporascus sp. CRB-9-2]